MPSRAPDDWNLEGACPLPRRSGNASQVVELLLERSHERCFEGGACNTWLAYIGDSLLRGPFNHLIDMLLGHEWPPGAGRNTFDLTTYHVDHRVCCTVAADDSDISLGPRLHDCEFTRAFDTVEYVRNFFLSRSKPVAGGGVLTRRSICITWKWNKHADADLRDALTNYTNSHIALSPQAIVVNPGLHVVLRRYTTAAYDEQVARLLERMQSIAMAQSRQSPDIVPTRFVVQDISALIDAHMPERKRAMLNETGVLRFNTRLYHHINAAINAADAPGSPKPAQWLRVLPAHRLTAACGGQAQGLVEPAGDGVHYEGGYSNIAAQLHLFFMSPDAPPRFCNSRL
jgi:hypothetical protein